MHGLQTVSHRYALSLSAKQPLPVPTARPARMVAALIVTSLFTTTAMLLLTWLSFETISQALHKWGFKGVETRYSRSVHDALMPRFRALSLSFFLVGLAAWPLRRRISLVALALAQSIREELCDLVHWVRARPWPLATFGFLVAVCAVAAALRLMFLFQPMRYDEAFTYVNVASQPVYLVVSKYDYPNNHIFHSLCVHVLSRILGESDWALRLPAFVAGLLLIPAAYGAACRLYNEATARLSSCLVAGSSILIEYSTNARGYTLVALCFLLMLIVASLVLKHKSLLAWGSLTVLGVIGFWTVPIMLFPYGIVMLWLGLAGLRSPETTALYGRTFLGYLGGCVLLTMFLTAMVYAPVLLVSGTESLIGNRFVKPLTWPRLWQEAPLGLLSTWRLWGRDMPVLLQGLLVGGLAITVLRHSRIAVHSVSVVGVAVFWCVLLVVVRRINPFERVWLFALPLYLMAASAGLVHLLSGWGGASRRWVLPTVCTATLVLLGWNNVQSRSVEQSLETGTLPEARELTVVLKERLRDEDRVLARCPSNAPLLYYFRKEGVPSRYLIEESELLSWQGRHLYVVVNRNHGQTLQELMQRYRLADIVETDSARLLHECPSAQVFVLRYLAIVARRKTESSGMK